MSFCLNEVELLNEFLGKQQPQIRSAMTEQHMSKFVEQRMELMHAVEVRVYGNEVDFLCWIPETKQVMREWHGMHSYGSVSLSRNMVQEIVDVERLEVIAKRVNSKLHRAVDRGSYSQR